MLSNFRAVGVVKNSSHPVSWFEKVHKCHWEGSLSNHISLDSLELLTPISVYFVLAVTCQFP